MTPRSLIKTTLLLMTDVYHASPNTQSSGPNFWETMPESTFEALVRRLETHGREERLVMTQELAAMGAKTVFDCGCGVSTQADMLWAPDEPISYMGIDSSGRMLRRARELRPAVTVAKGDVSLLPLDSQSVEAVIIRHVIEHLPDPYDGVIREALRVAQKGVVVDFFHVPLPWIPDDLPIHSPLGYSNNWLSQSKWENFLRTLGLASWRRKDCIGTSGQIAAIYVLKK